MEKMYISKDLAKEIVKVWYEADKRLKDEGLGGFDFYENNNDDNYSDHYFAVDLPGNCYVDLCIVENKEDKTMGLSFDFYVFDNCELSYGDLCSLEEMEKRANN